MDKTISRYVVEHEVTRRIRTNGRHSLCKEFDMVIRLSKTFDDVFLSTARLSYLLASPVLRGCLQSYLSKYMLRSEMKACLKAGSYISSIPTLVANPVI